MEELTALIKTSVSKPNDSVKAMIANSIAASIATSIPNSTVEFIKLPEVICLTRKSRSGIYLEEKAGTFPRAVRIGKRGKAYVKSEIIQWMEARMAERNTHIAGAK